MYKKTVVIILLIILVLASLTVFYFLRGINPSTGQPKSILDYLPFGQAPAGGGNTNTSGNSASGNTTGTSTVETGSSAVNIPALRKISQSPMAGAVIFDIVKPTAKTKASASAPWDASSTIRFISKADGHIFETTTETTDIKEISNTTIPLIYEALWSKKGDSLIARYLKNNSVQNYLIKLTPAKNSSTGSVMDVLGSFLPSDILGLASSPQGDKLFYLLQNGDGSIAITSNFDGTKKVQTWSSLFRDWNVSWPSENMAVLNTKAGSRIPGYLYTLNIKTGDTSKIVGDIQGLTSLVSPDMNYALIGAGDSLKVLNIKTGAYTQTSLNTLPEKCVWSAKTKGSFYCGIAKSVPAGNYPDDWYQGLVSFSDDVWKVDAESGNTNLISDINSTAGEDVDLINPALSDQENFLIFTNKKDSSLWGLSL